MIRPKAAQATGGLGAAAVVVGGVIAWRANSATALLVVGLILVALAWLGDRLESIILRHKDSEIQLKLAMLLGRKAEAAVNEALAADDPEEIRKQLQHAQIDLRLLSAYVERQTDAREPRRRLRTQLAWSMGAVFAMLELDDETLHGHVFCHVKMPDGSITTTQTVGPQKPGEEVQLPLAVPGVPGPYGLTWYWAFTPDGGGRREVAAASIVVPPEASDGWTSPWT